MSSQVFIEQIQKDSDICNNCFRRTHDTFERNYVVDTAQNDGETELWAREVDLPNRSWKRPSETTYVLGDTLTEGTHTGCKCGVGHAMSIRPVSKSTAMTYARRIGDRLEEKGVNFDRDDLLDRVREEMNDPDNQRKQDSDVFAVAVADSQHM